MTVIVCSINSCHSKHIATERDDSSRNAYKRQYSTWNQKQPYKTTAGTAGHTQL